MANDLSVSCPQDPPRSTSKRSEFGTRGCIAYGWPSTGGVLIKEVTFLDTIFLSLDRFRPSQRSSDDGEEDRFCGKMRRLGATWWASEQQYIDAELGLQSKTSDQRRILIFAWPTGGGLWMLRYESEDAAPHDIGKLTLAVDMDEKARVMQEYGAVFHEDPRTVKELQAGSS